VKIATCRTVGAALFDGSSKQADITLWGQWWQKGDGRRPKAPVDVNGVKLCSRCKTEPRLQCDNLCRTCYRVYQREYARQRRAKRKVAND
jgi:hypothetical protein